MKDYRVVVEHHHVRTHERIVRALAASDHTFHIAQVPEGESLLGTLQRTEPQILVVGVRFEDRVPVDGQVRAVRSRYPRRALAIVVIADGLAPGEELAASELGADACVRGEGLDAEVFASALARLADYVSRHSGERLSKNGVTLVRAGHQAMIGEETIPLTASTFELFWLLMDQAHRAVPLAELTPGAASFTDAEVRRIVQLNVHRLRRRLGTHRELVETVTGFGYRFNTSWNGS